MTPAEAAERLGMEESELLGWACDWLKSAKKPEKPEFWDPGPEFIERARQSVAGRFANGLIRTNGTGCHECWTKRRGSDQQEPCRTYGRIKVLGRHAMMHRLTYLIAHGRVRNWELVSGKYVNYHVHHKCENPACCNPEHLASVTERENVQISNLGKGGPGLEQMMELLRVGPNHSEIAKEFGVKLPTVRWWLRHLGIERIGHRLYRYRGPGGEFVDVGRPDDGRCREGHVLDDVGRSKSGWCKACSDEYQREYQRRWWRKNRHRIAKRKREQYAAKKLAAAESSAD